MEKLNSNKLNVSRLILGSSFFICGLYGLFGLVTLAFLTPTWIQDRLSQKPITLILLWGIVLSRTTCIIIALSLFKPSYKIKRISIALAAVIIGLHLFDIIKLVSNTSFLSTGSFGFDFDMGVLLFDISIVVLAILAINCLNRLGKVTPQ